MVRLDPSAKCTVGTPQYAVVCDGIQVYYPSRRLRVLLMYTGAIRTYVVSISGLNRYERPVKRKPGGG